MTVKQSDIVRATKIYTKYLSILTNNAKNYVKLVRARVL